MSIIPGMETRAPERTETSSGSSGLPKRFPVSASTLRSAASTPGRTSFGSFFPFS